MGSPVTASASSDVVFKAQTNEAAAKSWDKYFLGAAKRVTLVVLPAIVLIGLANLPTANAGPITYKSCVQGCINMGGILL